MNRTKLIIFLALEQLLKQKSFDKITVVDIVQNADISRATFYRHFRDKFDLANWYYRQKAEQVFQEDNQEPLAIFYGLSKFMGQDDLIFMQVMMNNEGQNSFFDFVSDTFYDYWSQRYRALIGRPLTKEEKFSLAIWSRGGALIWRHKLNEKEAIDPEEMAYCFLHSMPYFLLGLQDQK
ncbi:TetR/AcrR family transcriptional regulator [Hutsoniella sourekii]